jgi:ribosomal-protein-alanine acetyltransferase
MSKRTKQTGAHFTAVWEFRVSGQKLRAFEKAYGPNGDWARLFSRGDGYIRTELIRDPKTTGRYVTVDFWKSRQAFERFKKQNLTAYRALDKKCNSLTKSEGLIGEFEKQVPPDLPRVGATTSKTDLAAKHVIRQATLADLPAIIALEREAVSAAHWSEAAYRDILKQDAPARIALVSNDQNGATQGFVIARINGQDCELENILVADNARRQGMGSTLLQALIADARRQRAARIFLEVRQSNAGARAFYEKFGFALDGRRKSYYSNPAEDALAYTLTL